MSNYSFNAVDFPFSYLHNEIVRYFRERDVSVIKEKEAWLDRARQCDFSDLFSGESGDILRKQIFAQDNTETKLESMGHRIGYVLAQKASRDIPLLANELDIMKFICKEFWSLAFGKNVDNLRTNHQGIYIVQDNRFHTVAAFSEGTQYLRILRGALESFGVSSVVTAQVEKLPSVKFQIQILKK